MSAPCTQTETLLRIERKLDNLHNRLFVDNGTLSIQTSLSRGQVRMDAMQSDISALKARPRTVLAVLVSVASVASAAGGCVAWVLNSLNRVGGGP